MSKKGGTETSSIFTVLLILCDFRRATFDDLSCFLEIVVLMNKKEVAQFDTPLSRKKPGFWRAGSI